MIKSIKLFALYSLTFILASCGGSGDDPITNTPSINQAAYATGTTTYEYGLNSIPNMFITGAPADTDWSRSAMLHDGTTYRLYFFKTGTNDTLYQFGFNPASSDYEYGYNSISTLKITNAPADADPTSFAMLHDGTTYRLYMRSLSSPTTIHQFGFNGTTYAYGFNSITTLSITSGPADTDYDRWAMLYDGSTYRYYAFKEGSDTVFYQFGYNVATQDYEYGLNSILQLTVELMPATSNTNDFSMLHDGTNYRFYFLTK